MYNLRTLLTDFTASTVLKCRSWSSNKHRNIKNCFLVYSKLVIYEENRKCLKTAIFIIFLIHRLYLRIYTLSYLRRAQTLLI